MIHLGGKKSARLSIGLWLGAAHRNLIYIECSCGVSSHFGCCNSGAI